MRSQATALGVCAFIGLLPCTAASAEKTTVTVDRGQVRAMTDKGDVTITAGQKAVLAPGQKPVPGVDDPMVDDLLTIDKLAQAAKAARSDQLAGVLINICSIDSETRWKTAFLHESINSDKMPGTTCHFKNLAGLTEPRFYDMQGRLLKYSWKKDSRNQGPCDIYFPEPVAPGASFRWVCLGEALAPKECIWNDGKLWHVWQANDTRNYLNYFRFVLPKTAILLDVDKPSFATDVRDARLSVTVRNYTGEEANGHVELVFLWPEKDGSVLEDIPVEYQCGLDTWKAGVQDQYRERMAGIRAGQDYDDQSTPLATLLSANAALVRNDRERYIRLTSAALKHKAKEGKAEFGKLEAALGGIQGVRELLVDTVDRVDAPRWPKNPPEGATCRIVKYGKGSQRSIWTTGFVFHEGKWYWAWNRPGPGLPAEDTWIREHAKPRPTAGADGDRTAELTREYRTRMEQIRKGADYNDQSTPLAALLTRNAGIVRDDLDRLLATMDPGNDPERKAARQEIAELKKGLGTQGLREQIVDVVDSIDSPAWPDKPADGTIHRIDMFAKAAPGESPLPVFTMVLVYREGKWYVVSNSPGSGHPDMRRKTSPAPARSPGK